MTSLLSCIGQGYWVTGSGTRVPGYVADTYAFN